MATYDQIERNWESSSIVVILFSVLFIYIVYINYFKNPNPKTISHIAASTILFLQFVKNKKLSTNTIDIANTKKIYKKEVLIISILCGWTIFHSILFSISNGAKERFWPLDSDSELAADYDFSEFFIYGLIPWIILFVFKFLKRRMV